MSRYTGPSWKISRRLGMSLQVLVELARRPYAPVTGQGRRGKLSNTVHNYVKSKVTDDVRFNWTSIR